METKVMITKFLLALSLSASVQAVELLPEGEFAWTAVKYSKDFLCHLTETGAMMISYRSDLHARATPNDTMLRFVSGRNTPYSAASLNSACQMAIQKAIAYNVPIYINIATGQVVTSLDFAELPRATPPVCKIMGKPCPGDAATEEKIEVRPLTSAGTATRNITKVDGKLCTKDFVRELRQFSSLDQMQELKELEKLERLQDVIRRGIELLDEMEEASLKETKKLNLKMNELEPCLAESTRLNNAGH